MTDRPPEEGALDQLRKLLRWSLLPVSTTFDVLVPSPVQKRLARWRESVEERLRERALSAEDLLKNDAWVSFVIEATRCAVSTHEEEKLDALRNAVCNAAEPATESEWDIRQIFLSRLSEMRAIHVRLLRFLERPELVATPAAVDSAARSADRVKFVTSLMPDLADKGPLVEVILDDLVRWQLIEGVPPTSMPRNGTRPTGFGRGFVDFLRRSGDEDTNA